jgi:Domain of unknown function (DUF4384)
LVLHEIRHTGECHLQFFFLPVIRVTAICLRNAGVFAVARGHLISELFGTRSAVAGYIVELSRGGRMVERTLVWVASLVAVACAPIVAQDVKEITARELFYGVSSSKKPAPAPINRSSQNPKTTPTRVTHATKSELKGPAAVSVAYAPLGLRYSVLKRTAPGQFNETDANTTFHSGDGIRVSIESNEDAYLYIVNKGSSGTWSVLFPSPDINHGSNRLPAHQRIEVPAEGQFTFVDEPGEARLFFVLSRPPEADLEQLISSLSRGDQLKDIAVHSISDEFVGKVRSEVIARDLIFEKVHREQSTSKEHATYIVNVNDSDSSRVVADLSLQHR